MQKGRIALEVSESCQDCKFWDSYPSDRLEASLGKCKRYPPMTGIIKEGTSLGPECYWPVTKVGDWCGEFKNKVEEKKPFLNGMHAVKK